MNVKPVSNCPKCQAAGNVVDQQKVFVKMECPRCKGTWKTLGKI